MKLLFIERAKRVLIFNLGELAFACMYVSLRITFKPLIFKKFGRWVVILVPIILEWLLTTSVRGLLRYWVPRGGENNKSECHMKGL